MSNDLESLFNVSGDDDEVGADEDFIGEDEVGAKVFRNRRTGKVTTRAPNAPRAAPRPVPPSGMPRAMPSNKKVTLMGVSHLVDIAAGASQPIAITVQEDFKPERFVVATSSAAGFLLTDVKIGNTSMIPGNSPIPCEAFKSDTDLYIQWGIVKRGQSITFTVQNIGAAASKFYGAISGLLDS